MGRSPCCEKVGLRRGRWTAEEDQKLKSYILANGEGLWKSLPKNAGLLRCGKSCRLRWVNYLRSDLKRGKFSAQEDEIIINLHASMGNRWSVIAGLLPGRTDNEIKNYWNSHLGRRIDSYRRPNPSLVPPLAIAAAAKAGKRTAATGSKTKPYKNQNSSNPEPCRTPTPAPRTEESSSTISWEENKGENGNASMDSLTPWVDPLMELGISELGLGTDSLDDFLADADGILRTMEEAEMEKDNRACPNGDKSVNLCRNSDNPGSLEVNIGEYCWHDVGSPVNHGGGVGWDLDLDDWANEEWGQEQNTLWPRDREWDKYSEMVTWNLPQ